MKYEPARSACRHRAIVAAAILLLATVACAPTEGSRPRNFGDVAVVGLAPGPDDNRESIVQVYAARSYARVSRLVAVHTWIAFRRAGDATYTTVEAHRFRPHLSGQAVRICQKSYPDRRWHGAEPALLFEARGETADRAIEGIEGAVARYQDQYRLWPGPNSNTLTAELARSVDELQVDLPPTAIGKDFLPGWRIFAPAPSGTGWQVSFGGALGLLVAIEEGVEMNVLGAVFGVDLNPPALKLPIVGRLGFAEETYADPAAAEGLRHLPRETRCH